MGREGGGALKLANTAAGQGWPLKVAWLGATEGIATCMSPTTTELHNGITGGCHPNPSTPCPGSPHYGIDIMFVLHFTNQIHTKKIIIYDCCDGDYCDGEYHDGDCYDECLQTQGMF